MVDTIQPQCFLQENCFRSTRTHYFLPGIRFCYYCFMYTNTAMTELVARTMALMWECEIAGGRSVTRDTVSQNTAHRSQADRICGWQKGCDHCVLCWVFENNAIKGPGISQCTVLKPSANGVQIYCSWVQGSPNKKKILNIIIRQLCKVMYVLLEVGTDLLNIIFVSFVILRAKSLYS